MSNYNFMLYKNQELYNRKKMDIIDIASQSLRDLETKKIGLKAEVNNKKGKGSIGGSNQEISYLIDSEYDTRGNKLARDRDNNLEDLKIDKISRDKDILGANKSNDSGGTIIKSIFDLFAKGRMPFM